MEQYQTLEQLIAAGMPEHQLAAIDAGGGAHFQGHVYTREKLGLGGDGSLAPMVDSAKQIADLRAEIETLRARNADLEAQIASAHKVEEPVFTEDELSGNVDRVTLDNRSLKDLKALASARGIQVGGTAKAGYLDALSRAEEAK
jgi:hypothetical protein